MRKKTIFLVILAFATLSLTGQNLVKADYKPIHFGFTLGINAMDFGITPSLIPASDGRIYKADVDAITPGFSVGVIGNLRLSEYFALRLVPAIHFGQRDISYINNVTHDIEIETVKSNILTVPLYLKYGAVRVKNYRPYLIAGAGFSFDLGREREKAILLQQMDGFFDFGVGCTIYFQYFRFSPEIKFALGLTDILTPLDQRGQDYVSDYNKRFTNAISRLTSRLFTLTFNFE